MALLVTAPLFRRSLATEGYLLQCEDPETPVLEILSRVGVGTLCPNKPLWAPLTLEELAARPDLEPYGGPRQLTLLVPEAAEDADIAFLKEQGYPVAATGAFSSSLVDYHLLPEEWMADPDRKVLVRRLRSDHKITAVATAIDCWDSFEAAQRDDFQLFAGSFFFVPSLPSEAAISPIKANLVRLLNIVRSQDYEFDTITGVVRQDPALTVSLMRFINSPYLGVRNRVRSIQQAVTLLGQEQVRKWVTASVYKSLGVDRPGELTRVSLIRAKFAENLAGAFHLDCQADSLFLVGLFSALDVILGVSMDAALEMVPVTEEILGALRNYSGPYAPVLQLILSYEALDWETVRTCFLTYRLEEEMVVNAYLEALGWYSDLIASVEPTRGY